MGALVEVEWKDKWYRAEILDAREGEVFVHYTDSGHGSDDWVTPERVRTPQYASFEPGAKVELEASASGKWYPGVVLRAWRDMHLARWHGWPSQAYDEWFGPSRIRSPG